VTEVVGESMRCHFPVIEKRRICTNVTGLLRD